MMLPKALGGLIDEIRQRFDHFTFHAPFVNFFSKRGETAKKSENAVPDANPIVLLGEVVKTMFLVVLVVGLKGESESPIDVVPENLHGAHAKKSHGFDVAPGGRIEEMVRQGGQLLIQVGRVGAFIRYHSGKVGLLKFRVRLHDLPEMRQLGQRAGQDEPDLLPGKGRGVSVEKTPVEEQFPS